jgi:signal-transduction protein with cAMP-binding, CBS, and nucleotidyltransferase domain
MGLVTNVLSFAGGYVAGVKIGTRPATASRTLLERGQQRFTAAASVASDLRDRVRRGTPSFGNASLASSARTPKATLDIREVRDVMSATPATVRTTTPVIEAARLLETADIGSLIVVDQDETVLGVMTDRDIALRVVAAGRVISTTVVGDVMTESPETVSASASVQEAVALMRQRDVRRLPVVESGRAIGIIALADLATRSEARALLADISAAPPNN